MSSRNDARRHFLQSNPRRACELQLPSLAPFQHEVGHERLEGRRLAARMKVPLLELVSEDGAERLRQLAAFLDTLPAGGMR